MDQLQIKKFHYKNLTTINDNFVFVKREMLTGMFIGVTNIHSCFINGSLGILCQNRKSILSHQKNYIIVLSTLGICIMWLRTTNQFTFLFCKFKDTQPQDKAARAKTKLLIAASEKRSVL